MKRRNLEKSKTMAMALLRLLAVGSVITVIGLLSQGRGVDKMMRGFRRYAAWEIKAMLRRMKVQGLIQYDEEDEISPIRMTEKGFVRFSKENIKAVAGKKWDHFWRLILFDVSHRGSRQCFQRVLRSVGCYQIQKSVYAYPFDCRDDILRLAMDYGIARGVTILTIPDLGRHEKEARIFYLKRGATKKLRASQKMTSSHYQ